ncbi:hypothetical protein DFQ03_1604 [Maribacter caenipelagi]|uniref:Dihydroorotase n=1 Tax=Maribacter caenipelagi TaxID=1447781 RepID=A0A4R7DA42_9FLAO|nr:hypothetical protein [Maribacter caenipelagi]TDS17111.1 hypothetical protein DFQ03_1604 [Maribacter caenipelagi]|tara:strand:- start:213 stop:572 length:360 start_codon:yes stop_codon:yes gene_type:complete
MIKYAIALLFSASMLHAQDNTNTPSNVNVGDVFEIGKPETNKFKHIDFPRENFIIKRGGIANYRRAHGEEVVVTAVKEKKDGTTEIKIKRNDGGRFFNSHTVVTADFKEAINSGELQAL